LRSQQVLCQSRNSPHFKEPEVSLPHSPPPVPIQNQIDPVYAPTHQFLKIHLTIILPTTSGSSKWFLSLRFPHQNPYKPPLSPIHATCPAHLIFLDLITRTIYRRYHYPITNSNCNMSYDFNSFRSKYHNKFYDATFCMCITFVCDCGLHSSGIFAPSLEVCFSTLQYHYAVSKLW